MIRLMVTCFLLGSTLSANGDVERDIVGAWCESINDGSDCFGYEIFFSDGTVAAFGNYAEHDLMYEMDGVWAFKNDILCVYPGIEKHLRISTNQRVLKYPIKHVCVADVRIDTLTLSYRGYGEKKNEREGI